MLKPTLLKDSIPALRGQVTPGSISKRLWTTAESISLIFTNGQLQKGTWKYPCPELRCCNNNWQQYLIHLGPTASI